MKDFGKLHFSRAWKRRGIKSNVSFASTKLRTSRRSLSVFALKITKNLNANQSQDE
jgi:hypothetical protein